ARILAEAVNGKVVGKHGYDSVVWQRIGVELCRGEVFDLAGSQVGVKQPAIDTRWRTSQSKVAKNVFAVELRKGGTAIDETASDGNAVAVVIFQRAERAGNRINQVGWAAGAVSDNRAGT